MGLKYIGTRKHNYCIQRIAGNLCEFKLQQTRIQKHIQIKTKIKTNSDRTNLARQKQTMQMRTSKKQSSKYAFTTKPNIKVEVNT